MTGDWLSVCETGECLEIQIQGDTVVLRETSTPDDEVVTTLASWQAWQKQARDQERAAIVAALRNYPWTTYWSVADRLEQGDFVLERDEFADVAANHDDEPEDEFPVSMTFDDSTGRWGDGRLAASDD